MTDVERRARLERERPVTDPAIVVGNDDGTLRRVYLTGREMDALADLVDNIRAQRKWLPSVSLACDENEVAFEALAKIVAKEAPREV